MTRRIGLAAFALLGAAFTPGFAQQQPPAASNAVAAAPVDAVFPTLDVGRSLEAEVRIALNDLLTYRTISALHRLQWLSQSPALASAPPPPPGSLRNPADVQFLLSQAQYRLGMDGAFRISAEEVLAKGPPRYAPLIRAQLLLSAYRSGNFQRVAELARTMPADQTRGLASLVSGLADYELGNYAPAQARFAEAKRTGPPYAQYAEYMDVLATLRADTSRSALAITRLETLAMSSSGTFADQVRLTAAQLAYERGDYAKALSLAEKVPATSGLAPLALLTKAWSQYKTKDLSSAGQNFAAFADRYPELQQRDEARLMAAQCLLQLGKTDEAGRLFAMVRDSSRREAAQLSAGSATELSNLSRALVKARAAGLLYVQDPAIGKTVALEETAGADPQVLATALTGTAPVMPRVDLVRIVSFDEMMRRYRGLDSVAMRVPRRVLFVPSSGAVPASFSSRVEAVLAADLAASLASHRYEVASRNDGIRLKQITGVQGELQGSSDSLSRMLTRVDSLDAALALTSRSVDTTHQRLRASLVTGARSVEGGPAYIARVRADSLRQSGAIPAGVDVEAMIASRTDSLINQMPLFLLRDSARVRLGRVRSELVDSKVALDDAHQAIAVATAGAIPGGDSTAASLAQLRADQAAANRRRIEAEAALMAAVNTELSARATELVAQLEHDRQAAEFGTATSSFFKMMDLTKPASGPGSKPSGEPSGGSKDGAQSGELRQRTPTSNPAPPRRPNTPPSDKK